MGCPHDREIRGGPGCGMVRGFPGDYLHAFEVGLRVVMSAPLGMSSPPLRFSTYYMPYEFPRGQSVMSRHRLHAAAGPSGLVEPGVVFWAPWNAWVKPPTCFIRPRSAQLFARDNLVAWCIVPLDQKKRGPEERAAMLKRLGFTRFAYDWRPEHVATFDAEIDALTHLGTVAGGALRSRPAS